MQGLYIITIKYIYTSLEVEMFLRHDSSTFIHLDQFFYNNPLSRTDSRVISYVSFDSKDHPQNHTSHNI